MQQYLNISTYKFLHLNGLKAHKEALLSKARSENLKGTVLLAPEGINFFIAGYKENVYAFLECVHQIDGLEHLEGKESYSSAQPFTRMLVRIKRETIPFSQRTLDPASNPAPYITPEALKSWYDSGKNFIIIDTRNDYEVRVGTFKNSIHFQMTHFKEFADAIQNLRNISPTIPIVTFCTGGIRCEKAAPYMQQNGFHNVVQLEGGILKYFEKCGGAHYEGDCFVFDKRVALNFKLQETGMKQCYRCRAPLTKEDESSVLYEENFSCPHCYHRHINKQ